MFLQLAKTKCHRVWEIHLGWSDLHTAGHTVHEKFPLGGSGRPLKECAEPALPGAVETGEQRAAAKGETRPQSSTRHSPVTCRHSTNPPCRSFSHTHPLTSIYKHAHEFKGGKESERVGARGWWWWWGAGNSKSVFNGGRLGTVALWRWTVAPEAERGERTSRR